MELNGELASTLGPIKAETTLTEVFFSNSTTVRLSSPQKKPIFFDEFDTLGKIRDYSQDHGEMKRIVNTILQLFDYLPQSSIVIAATNQVGMIDDALLRRFDLNIGFNLPDKTRIKELIELTLKNGKFHFDKTQPLSSIIDESIGLSYYTIQKTLITAIKRSLFNLPENTTPLSAKINTQIWKELISKEKKTILTST